MKSPGQPFFWPITVFLREQVSLFLFPSKLMTSVNYYSHFSLAKCSDLEYPGEKKGSFIHLSNIGSAPIMFDIGVKKYD